MKAIGSKVYDVCHRCGDIVCLNKFLIGGMHVCISEEEAQRYETEQHMRNLLINRIKANTKRLNSVTP